MRLLLTAALTLLLALPAHAQDWHFPAAQWEMIEDPRAAGYAADALAALPQLLQTMNTQALHVSVRGRQLFSYGDITDDGYLASVRKSILAMLYGRYVKRGVIDLDATLLDLGMDDVGGLLDIEKRASVRDIISARSGVYHAAANGGDNSADAPARGSQAPGTYFLYNNWDFNIAGGIFEELTSRGVFDELDAQLARPLQFQDFDLARHEKSGDPERSRYLAYHMHLSARDLARVGHLMLSRGRWGERQLIDPEWVAEMVQPHTSNREMNPASTRATGLEYGYMWWVFDNDTVSPAYRDAYAGRGHYGQYLIVLPALDMVIAHKTEAIPYDTPEEYQAVRVTWEDFITLVDAVLATRLP
jgi:CubicO group peptidase (beta-lactamase class C family)